MKLTKEEKENVILGANIITYMVQDLLDDIANGGSFKFNVMEREIKDVLITVVKKEFNKLGEKYDKIKETK